MKRVSLTTLQEVRQIALDNDDAFEYNNHFGSES